MEEEDQKIGQTVDKPQKGKLWLIIIIILAALGIRRYFPPDGSRFRVVYLVRR